MSFKVCLIPAIVRFSTRAATQRSVRVVSYDSLRWFPGHMRKGMNDLNTLMSKVDVILEVHDARIPFTGRSGFILGFGQVRPHILILNKIDLAEQIEDLPAFRSELTTYSSSFGDTLSNIYFTRLNAAEKQQKLLRHLISSLPKLAKEVAPVPNYSKEFGPDFPEDCKPAKIQPTVLTAAVGIPNCGKSTLINALRAIGGGGSGGAARVGRLAGQTRSVGHPIVISRGNPSAVADSVEWSDRRPDTDVRVMILDSPGILEPQARNLCEQLSLCVCGSVNLDLVDQELLVDYLLFWWNHRGRTEYVSALGLPGPTDNVTDVLAHVCTNNSFLLSPGSTNRVRRGPSWQAHAIESLDSYRPPAPRPDFKRAANHILRLFNQGAFGRATFLPQDHEAASRYFVLPNR